MGHKRVQENREQNDGEDLTVKSEGIPRMNIYATKSEIGQHGGEIDGKGGDCRRNVRREKRVL